MSVWVLRSGDGKPLFLRVNATSLRFDVSARMCDAVQFARRDDAELVALATRPAMEKLGWFRAFELTEATS